jgi:hypothetical protein
MDFFVFVLLLRAQKKNQEKGKKNDASSHRPTPSPPFFWPNAQRRVGYLSSGFELLSILS